MIQGKTGAGRTLRSARDQGCGTRFTHGDQGTRSWHSSAQTVMAQGQQSASSRGIASWSYKPLWAQNKPRWAKANDCNEGKDGKDGKANTRRVTRHAQNTNRAITAAGKNTGPSARKLHRAQRCEDLRRRVLGAATFGSGLFGSSRFDSGLFVSGLFATINNPIRARQADLWLVSGQTPHSDHARSNVTIHPG